MLYEIREQQAEAERERIEAESALAKQMEELMRTESLPDLEFEPITLPPVSLPDPAVSDAPVASAERRRPAGAPAPAAEVPPLRLPAPKVNAGRKVEIVPRLRDAPPLPAYGPRPGGIPPKKGRKGEGAVEGKRPGAGTVAPQIRAPREQKEDRPGERLDPERPRPAAPPVGGITHTP